MRSTPISIMQQRRAGSEKNPLVVIQKCSRNVSRNQFGPAPSRTSAMLMRHNTTGSPSPSDRERGIGETPARRDPEMRAKRVAEPVRPGPVAPQRHVDAPQQKRQPLAEMAEDNLDR